MCKIAICQFSPELNNINSNLKEVNKKLHKAKKMGADLAVFPELALTGFYIYNKSRDLAQQVNESGAIDKIRKKSRELSIDTVIGYPRIDKAGNVFNSAMYIQKGKVLGIHDKIYLANYHPFHETDYLFPGDTITVLESDLGRIAILISEDAWHLSTSLVASQLGAQLIIICAATAVEDRQKLYKVQYSWETVNTAIGFSQTIYVVYNNRSGSEENLAFWGGSHVIDYTGTLIKKAKIFSSDIMIADIDFTAMEKLRREFPRVENEKNSITLSHLLSRDQYSDKDN